ncbi:MAG: transglycosylase SLT domain-containing protein [Anaerolineae bacterium]
MPWLALLLATVVGCSGIQLPENPLLIATQTPTLQPSPTPTTTPTPTATPSPTPTPTPTPMPSEILGDARQAQRYGDWESAQRAYERLLVGAAASPDQVVTATLGLAQVYLALEAPERAVELLQSFIDVTSDVEVRADAQLLLADALKATGAYEPAAEHYAAVTEARPFLRHHTENWRGDVLYAAGVLTEALTAYGSALDAAESAPQRVWVLEKIALTQAAANDVKAALEAYDRILAIAQIPDYRARIMYQAADTALTFGEVLTAYMRMEALIAAYPESSEAYDALVTLVEVGRPVDDRLRGLVDYHAEAYDPAIRAFYRIILGDPNHDGEPHYYAGLSYLELDLYQRALEEFDMLIDTHPGDPFVPAAWMGRAEALAGLGRLEDAVDSYEMVASLFPDHERSPEALWEAAELLADTRARRRASELLVSLAEQYPDDEGAPEARFKAGLLRYRDDDPAGAVAIWRDLIDWYPYDHRAQAAWFWLGKTYLGAGKPLSATEALSEAISLGPWDFYGLRAADLVEGREPFADQYVQPTPCDDPDLQRATDAWLASWLELEPDVNVDELSAELANDDRWRRGTILLRLGHFDEARAELEALRVATVDNPLAQYRLALAYRDIGLYRSSIIAAAALRRLSPAQSLAEAPRFLGCLEYPTYYSDLVEREAAAQGVGPLFVYALLRQESLFEGSATSFAAAHGLMQVIPPTGAYIAEALGWPPDYETPDLYRPMVSVRFGIWYLAEQLDFLDGNLFAAMAAYNGGPGNALRWWNQAGGDPDIFVELIGFEETRRYVRLIYEHYNAYTWLYAEPQPSTTP